MRLAKYATLEKTGDELRLNSVVGVQLLSPLPPKGGDHTGQKKRELLNQTPKKPEALERPQERACPVPTS